MFTSALYIGSFTTARTVRLGYVSAEEPGLVVRAVEIAPGVALAKVAGSHWVLRFGVLVRGELQALDEVGLTDGCPISGKRHVFAKPLRLEAGSRPAMEAFAYGTPPALQHVSVTLEPAILGGR